MSTRSSLCHPACLPALPPCRTLRLNKDSLYPQRFSVLVTRCSLSFMSTQVPILVAQVLRMVLEKEQWNRLPQSALKAVSLAGLTGGGGQAPPAPNSFTTDHSKTEAPSGNATASEAGGHPAENGHVRTFAEWMVAGNPFAVMRRDGSVGGAQLERSAASALTPRLSNGDAAGGITSTGLPLSLGCPFTSIFMASTFRAWVSSRTTSCPMRRIFYRSDSGQVFVMNAAAPGRKSIECHKPRVHHECNLSTLCVHRSFERKAW